MANSPLFQELQRAMRLARVASSTGWSAEEVLQRWRAGSVDHGRRAFLRASALAAAGAAAACTPMVPRRDGPGDAEVAVVGAGIAGLTAAYRLHQAGVRVRVFEAQNRIGGRMLSIRNHFADGQVAELGAELIDTGHQHMRALAAELGLVLDDFETDEPQLARAVWYFDGRRRSDREVVEAFTPIAAVIERDLATLGDGDISYREPQNAEALDRLSIEQWFDRNGVTGWIRKLLAVAYTTEMGLEPDQQSALNLLTFIDPAPDPFRIFGESDERFHVRGGNDRVTSGLGQRLDGLIETGAVLEAVTQLADGSYRLSLRRDAASQEIKASHVILALPIPLLRQIKLDLELPAIQRRAIAELAYGTNAKLMIGFAQRTWRRAANSDGSSFADLPFQSSWETSRAQPGTAGILTNFVGGRHGVEIGQGTAAEQAALAVAGLDKLFPGLAAQRAGMTQARFHWPTNPWVQGSYLCLRPGDWTALGGAIAEPVGRLRFAGEHCSVDNQGFMEGGCESGEQTAKALLEELGVRSIAAGGRRGVLGLART